MNFRSRITEALQRSKPFTQGNYTATLDNGTIHVSMFGNRIFAYDPARKVFAYDFCGYEGFPKTTSAINTCLAAVGAGYRVKTVNHLVIEYSTSDETFQAVGRNIRNCDMTQLGD